MCTSVYFKDEGAHAQSIAAVVAVIGEENVVICRGYGGRKAVLAQPTQCCCPINIPASLKRAGYRIVPDDWDPMEYVAVKSAAAIGREVGDG